MTRDEIMHLADSTAGEHWMDEAHVQRFASALIAAERDACMQETKRLAVLIVAAEREAICSIVYGHCGSDNDAQRIVDAIRARSAK